MGIKRTFSREMVMRKLQADLLPIEQIIVARLQYLGEQCVNIARSLDTYKDQTANLRNSIGYIIAKDGKLKKDNYKKTKSGAMPTSEQGDLIGRALALKILSYNQKGFILIVTAGMNYAKSVELKGYDVLTSAEQYAKQELPGLKAQLQSDFKRIR